MNKTIDHVFSSARSAGVPLLCPFLTAGYPNLETGPDILLAMESAGSGLIELGIPFSDPIADGPIIQESYRIALQHGATVDRILAMVSHARSRGLTIPILAMASFSIIFKRGSREFATACRDAGINGLVLPDIPSEEAPEVVKTVQSLNLGTSLLVAPTTPHDRRRQIAELCDAFVYYVSVTGITGERATLPSDIAASISQLRSLTTRPICVGFGISTADQVRSVSTMADGVIVGSALIRRLTAKATQSHPDFPRAAGTLIAELALGLPKHRP